MNPTGILSIPARAHHQPADLTFLAYLDIWIISGLVLLAVVVVLGKLVWGRLRRRDEEEHDYYYDDEYILDDEYQPDQDR